MGIRRFGVNLGRGQPVAETEDVLGTEKATALAVPAIDADVDSEVAVAAIGTSQGTADVKVLIEDTTTTPTKANVRAALEAVIAHIEASNTYA
jgi:hypothetical protein